MVAERDIDKSLKRLEQLKRQAEKDRLNGLAKNLKEMIAKKKQ